MSKSKPALLSLSLSLLIPLLANLISPLSSFSQTQTETEETLTITTYYPAPYGVYNEMRAKRMAVGDNYINGSSYSWDTGSINADADLVVEGNVGIGTVSPNAGGEQPLKLDVEGAIGAKFYCDENGNNCSSAATNQIAFLATKNGIDQTFTSLFPISSGKITFIGKDFDIGNYFDNSKSRYTPPAGIYYIGASYMQKTGPRNMSILIFKNGSRIMEKYVKIYSDKGGSVSFGTLVSFNGTEYIELAAYFVGDTPLDYVGDTVISGDRAETYFYGFKIDK